MMKLHECEFCSKKFQSEPAKRGHKSSCFEFRNITANSHKRKERGILDVNNKQLRTSQTSSSYSREEYTYSNDNGQDDGAGEEIWEYIDDAY